MKIRFIILALLSSVMLTANSVFSFDGMPQEYFGYDVYSMGMGNTGIADVFRINVNYTNPSLLTTANKVTFGTAVKAGYIKYQDSQTSFRDDGLHFPYFTFAVPINSHKLGFCFNDYSSGNLDVEKSNEVLIDGSNYETTEEYKIESNIYRASLLYALKNEYLNVGISVDFYLGHRIKYWELDFSDGDLNDVKYEKELRFKNAGISVGFNKKWDKIALGLSYRSNSSLYGDHINRFRFVPYADTLDTNIKDLYKIPQMISGGLTYKSDVMKYSFDIHYELWDGCDVYQNEQNSLQAGIGIAYDPISGYGEWYQRIPVRTGYSYRELPFKKNNSLIREHNFNLGFTLPLKATGKKIELALEYVMRGDKSTHGIQDRAVMFSIGVKGFDFFTKRRRKTAPRDIPEADKDMVDEI